MPNPQLRQPTETSPQVPMDWGAYVELHVRSNFTFLDGASHPDELAETAARLEHKALAVTDRNTLAGAVQMQIACRRHGLRLVVGCQLDLTDFPSLLCFPSDKADYGDLVQLITLGRRRAPKGRCDLTIADVLAADRAHSYVLLPPAAMDGEGQRLIDHALHRLTGAIPTDRLWIAGSVLYRGDDRRRLAVLNNLGARHGVPLLATNAVKMHGPDRRRLSDILTCIREIVPIHQAGRLLDANAERHLKPAAAMAALFADHPGAIAQTRRLADRCRFQLTDLAYSYPREVAGDVAETAQQRLERLSWEGARWRYPDGVPDQVADQIRSELALIGELGYAAYFLTVEDVVRFARSRGILCQGRGSAANSTVCFVLGVTAVDPTQMDLLFARFISAERKEPPDIDVDFEHERREEVIQYIYEKYGRHRAGMTATVIRYRPRGALRDVGKAMGLSTDVIGKMTKTVWGHYGRMNRDHIAEGGIDLADPWIQETLSLVEELLGFPRHLSQHTGGMVISEEPLNRIVPIQNAAMAERTVIEWDKDDLDALGMIKVDILALGMLSCVRRAFDLIRRHYGRSFELATLPQGDAAVYAMLSRADSLGVFQVESRAQMTMLPRLKPQTFYDLVIEVAIVRPGPIQGDMVHPYLRRRQGKEPVSYPSADLRRVLEKTLGVPQFQEQAMKIAIVAAGFSEAEADGLRRPMATFRKVGTIHGFEEKMVEGMVARGYDRGFAERVFRQVEGFGEYGFPESHAASFALLVYVSAWIKCHCPDVFCAALINSQPMGFYAPAQIVRDAEQHGVEIRPVDVNHSNFDCTLEPSTAARRAVRLGMRLVKGLAAEAAERIAAHRGTGYATPEQVMRRADVGRDALEALARADAFASMGHDRRQALWAVKALEKQELPLFAAARERDPAPVPNAVPDPALPRITASEEVVADYRAQGLTLRSHPMTFLRPRLRDRGIRPCSDLAALPHGRKLTVAGVTLMRQRPGTAKGIIFLTLEDETGIANLVVFPNVSDAHRPVVMAAGLVIATGRIEKADGVIHLRVTDLEDGTGLLNHLVGSEDDATTMLRRARSFH